MFSGELVGMKAAKIAVLLVSFLWAGYFLQAHQPHDYIETVAVSPDFESDRTLFCSLSHVHSFVLKSEDGGETWWPAQSGMPYGITKAFAISPAFGTDETLFAAINRTEGPGEVFRSDDGGASWTARSDGLDCDLIDSLAISPDFANDGILFAGTSSGVFRTLDGGLNWSPSSSHPYQHFVYAIALSPNFSQDTTLFAATSRGLIKSIDGGANWFNPIYSGWSDFRATDIVLSPDFASDEALFISVWGDGVYRSVDGGQTLTEVNQGISDTGLQITALTISPAFPTDGTVYVALGQEGVFKSTNFGNLWQAMNNGIDEQAPQTDVHYFDLAISPAYASDKTVLLAAWEGLHLTRSGGKYWWHLDTFSRRMIRAFCLSPNYATDGTVFAGAYGGGIFKSTDNGDSWFAFSEGLTNMFLASLAVSPAYALDNTVFAGITKHVMKTNSNRWASVPVHPPDYVIARTMAFSPFYPSDGTFFVGNDFSGTYPLYRTIDHGKTFDVINPGFTAPRCLAISPNYNMDKTVFVGNDQGVIRSCDGGNSWVQLGLAETRVFCLAVSPDFATSGTIFAGTMNLGVQRSDNRGEDWTAVNTGIPDVVTIESLAISPNTVDCGMVYAGTRGRGVFRSEDKGDTWQPSGLENEFIRNLACSPSFGVDDTLFAGCWYGVYRSQDRGLSWQRVLDVDRIDNPSEYVKYSGEWNKFVEPSCHGMSLHFSQEAGDWAGIFFEGESIAWIGHRGPLGGMAAVLVDSVFQRYVDTYASENQWQEVLFEKSDLGPGLHTILVVNQGIGSSSSNGTVVAVDAFEIGY